MPDVTRSRSSATPMTPVDATRTSVGSHPSAAAAADAIARAVSIPSAPVHAFAQPLLMTTALAWPPDAAMYSRAIRTGAACALFVVNTAAADARASAATSDTSRPDFLIPDATPAARKPAGAATPPATGVTRRSATVTLVLSPRRAAHRQEPASA